MQIGINQDLTLQVGVQDPLVLVLEMMMMTQYFDTMKEVGTQGGNSTIFVPSGPGAVAEASRDIRMGLMQGQAAQIGRGA